MSKLLLSLFCLCFFFSAGYSQTKAQWREFAPEEGRFRIEFPKTPEASLKDVAGASGTIKLRQFDTEIDGVFLAVSYADYPAYPPEQDEQQLKKSYDAIRDIVRQQATAATFLGEQDIRYDGKLGREMLFEMDGVTVCYRLLLIGTRMYQPMASYKTSLKDDAATKQQVSRFLNSFKIIDE